MTTHYLQVSEDGGVVVCTLSNPPRHTLVAAAVGELHTLVDTLARRSTVLAYARHLAGRDAAVAMRSWLEGKPWRWEGR